MHRSFVILVGLGWLALTATAAQAETALQVYLPRAVQVEGESLTLGDIAVVRGDNEKLAATVAAVSLGRAPLSKEEITLDRPTILGRLRASGVETSQVTLSGSDKVVVGRKEVVWPVGDLVKAAEACLAKDRPSPAGSTWRMTRPPTEIVAPAGREARLEARLVAQEVTGEAKVEVAVIVDGRRVAAQAALFRLSYVCREAVATVDLAAGAVMTPENVTIRTVASDAPPVSDWTPPFGQVASQPIRQGAVIRSAQTRTTSVGVAIRRNEAVVMRIQGDGFLLTGLGLALEDGRPGTFIKVRNVDSGRVITAKVAPDGAVEPVFEGAKS
jgi:flagellar basal body P-ring formation protein FlgA